MIEVIGLTKCYGTHTAVDHITFSLEQGQVYGLLGPNGAGKSTTMKMLTGCLFPDGGTISISGYDLFEHPDEAKGLIGYLPELPPLYASMTPKEYLRFVAEAKGVAKGEIATQVAHVMALTQIEAMGNRLIHHLSKGYCQRVGIAQALLGDPKVLILDEPTVGLDPAQIIEVRNLIKELGKTHTIVISSHILAEISAICDRILIMSEGELIANDSPENLRLLVQAQDVLHLTVAAEKSQITNALEGCQGISNIECTYNESGHCSVSLHLLNGASGQDDVLRHLAAEGLRILEMGIQSMSLEDIFLTLTAQSKERKRLQQEEKSMEDTP